MTKRVIALCVGICFAFVNINAQEDTNTENQVVSPHAKHMWEFGIHAGHSFLNGDIDWDPGIGAGIHLRKALDYVFSIRFDSQFDRLRGTPDVLRGDGIDMYETTLVSGSVQTLISINNLVWHKPERKANVYLLGGVGGIYADIELTKNGIIENPIEDRKLNDITSFVVVGGGVSIKASDRFNLGFEHNVRFLFGKQADLLDGFDNVGNNGTTYRDVLNYTSLRFNFNLGKKEKKSQPLYWVNAMAPIQDDISELKARPQFDLTDSDGDGVIDMIDQEPDTPAGAAVDTRGVLLDSDGDGIADYRDQEPYSPIGYEVDENGKAKSSAVQYTTEDDVNRIVDNRLATFGPTSSGGGVANWFLPLIHFDLDEARVKLTEYGKLSQIATVMEQNPGIRLVVIGHTDRTASKCYNDKLSYRRADNAINYLVQTYSIDRNRFVLIWKGEDNVLVPTETKNYINRRVEFKVASNEANAAPPNCDLKKGASGYSGNREAGY